MINTTQIFLNNKSNPKTGIYNIISKVCDDLQFTMIEYSCKKINDNKIKISYMVKPKIFDLSVGLLIEYNLFEKEITAIEDNPKTGFDIIKALTIDTLKENFDPDLTFTTIFKEESDEYMIQNGYKLAINAFLLNAYIQNL